MDLEALKALRGKGAAEILMFLFEGKKRFVDLETNYVLKYKRRLSPQTLAKRINQLERAGWIKKEEDGYVLTEKGMQILQCILKQMNKSK